MILLAASNIAWTKEYDEEMYEFLHREGICGLEIAPTRIFQDKPYEHLTEVRTFAEHIRQNYGLTIPSMQSIWFGRNEKIFASREDRAILLEYTKEAMQFAKAAGCGNLVFGCPGNRSYQEADTLKEAIPFFHELGEYALQQQTVLAMEANPVIYNTNFCNTTKEAIELIKETGSGGFKLNLDIGTMLENEEDLTLVEENMQYINHIHISEPYLELPKKRKLHVQLAELLKMKSYDRFVSLETKTQEKTELVKDTLLYLKDIFA